MGKVFKPLETIDILEDPAVDNFLRDYFEQRNGGDGNMSGMNGGGSSNNGYSNGFSAEVNAQIDAQWSGNSMFNGTNGSGAGGNGGGSRNGGFGTGSGGGFGAGSGGFGAGSGGGFGAGNSGSGLVVITGVDSVDNKAEEMAKAAVPCFQRRLTMPGTRTT